MRLAETASPIGRIARRAPRPSGSRFVRTALALFLGLAMVPAEAPAKDAPAGTCRKGNGRPFSGLDQIYVRDEFRIIYATAGHHALPDVRDLNRNGIPDQVEDVGTQLVVGRRLFSDVMGMMAPMKQPRYQRTSSIDVFLLNMEKGNGFSYDEVMNYGLRFDGAAGRCALRIDINNTLPTRNVTPAHELFHQYQYGYSMFKTRWFLEGTARWAEYALRPGQGPQAKLPGTAPDLRGRLFSQSYGAGGVWNRLAAILHPGEQLSLPPDLEKQVYVDGTPVIHGDLPRGAGFMKEVLVSLGRASDEVSSRNGWNKYNWAEQDQRSPIHDEEMLRAILGVVHGKATEQGISNSELNGFLKLGPH